MTLPLWATPFVDDSSLVTADFLNSYVRTQIPRALDGIGGGSYALTSNLVITGSGFVLDYLQMSGTNRVRLASRSVQRWLPNHPASRVNGSGVPYWHPIHAGKFLNDIIAGEIDIPIRVPHGATLTQVIVYLWGGAGHGALPGNMPSLTLYSVPSSGLDTAVGSQVDTSASVAAFEAAHSITLAVSHTADRVNTRLVAQLKAESGANSLVGATYIGTRIQYTITEYDED